MSEFVATPPTEGEWEWPREAHCLCAQVCLDMTTNEVNLLLFTDADDVSPRAGIVMPPDTAELFAMQMLEAVRMARGDKTQ